MGLDAEEPVGRGSSIYYHNAENVTTIQTEHARRALVFALMRQNGHRSHECILTDNMDVQTKFLWLRQAVASGDRIDGWRVCWLGGWDRFQVFFMVMVPRDITLLVSICFKWLNVF